MKTIISVTVLALMISLPVQAFDDPTRPEGMASSSRNAEAPARPRLLGIMTDGRRDRVIINGAVLTEGQAVDDVRVLDIQRSRVIVEQGGRTLSLKWQKPPNIKRTP